MIPDYVLRGSAPKPEARYYLLAEEDGSFLDDHYHLHSDCDEFMEKAEGAVVIGPLTGRQVEQELGIPNPSLCRTCERALKHKFALSS